MVLRTCQVFLGVFVNCKPEAFPYFCGLRPFFYFFFGLKPKKQPPGALRLFSPSEMPQAMSEVKKSKSGLLKAKRWPFESQKNHKKAEGLQKHKV